MTATPPPRYETITQAAQRFSVHRTTIVERIESGELRAYRFGSKAIRLRIGDVDALLQEINRGEVA